MKVRFVTREEIEKVKWDSCVHYANKGNPFGYTWYLDNVAKDWDGLVEGEYESVFPLIKRKRKGTSELYTPDLLPKSGIYSIHVLSQPRLQAFWDAIPNEYALRDIEFPTRISLSGNAFLGDKKDYELDLRQDYDTISKGYRDELRQGLEVIHQTNFMADAGLTPEQLTGFYVENNPTATEERKHTYLRIVYNFMHRGTGFISSMKDEADNILAADVFAYSHGKVISLMPTFKGEMGKFSLWKLYDLMLQSHSDKPSILDFNTQMGTVQPELFGAKPVLYSHYQENRLKGLKKWWVGL